MTDAAATTRGVGVLLGLLGSIGINVGNNMQALGMGKIERQKRRDSIARRCSTPPPKDTSGQASSSSEPTASPTRADAGPSSPATDIEDDSSTSAQEAEHPNAVALRSLREPNAALPARSQSLGAPAAVRTPEGPRSKDDLSVGRVRKHSKELAKSMSTPRPLRPLVRSLTESAIAVTESVGTLVPQLTPSLLSPRMATLGSARGLESRGDSFDSLDSVEFEGRIKCVFGGHCIKTVGTIIFVTGSVINFIAFALAPASILAPLESIQVRARSCHPLPPTLASARTLALIVLTLTLAQSLT